MTTKLTKQNYVFRKFESERFTTSAVAVKETKVTGLDHKTIQHVTDTDTVITADCASQALRIYLRHKLAAGWAFSRQSDGWIIASRKDKKALGREIVKFREENYVRGNRAFDRIA